MGKSRKSSYLLVPDDATYLYIVKIWFQTRSEEQICKFFVYFIGAKNRLRGVMLNVFLRNLKIYRT